nr:coiled-coil domain-containing protein 25 isoform X1 [Gorilla gorilla gorilla]
MVFYFTSSSETGFHHIGQASLELLTSIDPPASAFQSARIKGVNHHAQPKVNSSAYTIYMGKDKYENEDLIKHGWPEDIWFHVDKLSSAHVYLRLHKGENIEDIPKEVLMDCAHLVKANSIQGCKMNNVNVVYTPWSNLKKTADMDVGQIGFHRQKDVKIVTVEKKVNEILNRLEKTKVERFPDLAAEKECRDREERNEKKAQIQEMKKREKEEMKKKREMDELRSYSSLMKVENMSSNQRGIWQGHRTIVEGRSADKQVNKVLW